MLEKLAKYGVTLFARCPYLKAHRFGTQKGQHGGTGSFEKAGSEGLFSIIVMVIRV